MTPLGMQAALRGENAELRGLTGSGEPGLATLLGGTAPEKSGNDLSQMGGPGQVSATSRLAQVHKDQRIRAVASGTSIPSGSFGTGYTPGGSSKPPQDRPRTQAK